LNILITGISGFVGGHLVEHIQRLNGDYAIYGTTFGDLPGYFSEFDPAIIERSSACDLTDREKTLEVFRNIKPDLVFHLAALSSVADAWQAAETVLTNNIVSQLNILEATRLTNPKARVVVISSSEVYGKVRPDEIPITESNALRPCNPYSVSKVSQEFLAYHYAETYGLDIIVIRPFNHIGPRQHGNFVVPSFARQIAAIEADAQPPIISVGNLSAQRDFTDVRDVARAYWLLATLDTPGEIYNVASGNAIEIEKLLAILLEYARVTIEARQNPDLMRPSDTPIIAGSFNKLEKATGWRPERNVEETLLETLNYWRKNSTT